MTIIRAGRTVQTGSLNQLRHLMRTTVTARIRGDAAALRESSSVHDFAVRDGRVTFSVDRDDLNHAMDELTKLGLLDLTVSPASLEELFLREYQGARQ